MEITKQQIDRYISKLIERKKLVDVLIAKNPITGVDVSKLDMHGKMFLGGIRKLAIEIDEEILSVYNFVHEFDKDVQLEVDEVVKKINETKIQLFDFVGDDIKLSGNIEAILKDIK